MVRVQTLACNKHARPTHRGSRCHVSRKKEQTPCAAAAEHWACITDYMENKGRSQSQVISCTLCSGAYSGPTLTAILFGILH